ncbi:MAG: hypothetical protein LBT78_02145, partial [Tannerella sp.]|jgi:arylsulfatase|nr:hypothetical protein [Tannerella sp.]
LTFAYNVAGNLTEIVSTKPVPSGDVVFKAEVIYGNGTGVRPKTVNLYINGEQVAVKDIGALRPVNGGNIEAGRNFGTPVSTAYKSPFIFTGNLKKVTIEKV